MKTEPAFVVIGSNVEPEARLQQAVRLLAERVTVRAVSRVYETPPTSGASQPVFLDAAVLIETGLPPAVLKFDVLRPIEAELGRDRSQDAFGLYPIDLDLVLYGSLILDDPASRLTLPDPDTLTQPHVALTLADLAPDFVHPTDGRTLAEIAAQFAGAAGVRVYPLRLATGKMP